MKTIKPLFPNQQSITSALEKLSVEDRATYDQLLLEYKAETEKDEVDHERIAKLIGEAQKILQTER